MDYNNLSSVLGIADQAHALARDVIVAELQQVANVSDFARNAELPRRTLVRIISGSANPSLETCGQIAAGLRKFHPAKRAAE